MKNNPPKKKTRTSAFGTPGRISHDASAFYAGKLYSQVTPAGACEYIENPVPPEFLNTILAKSSESMAEIPDHSVHLMVTSPPYNVGKDYDEDLTLEDYLGFLHRVWQEVHRVLVPGGRACINIANLGRKPYIPLHSYIVQDMAKIGFLMRGEIIWNKAASASPSTAWGSWCSPGNPTLRDVHEYISIFSKAGFSRQNPHKRQATITREEFLELTKSVWTFPAVAPNRWDIQPRSPWSCPIVLSNSTPMKERSSSIPLWEAVKRPLPRSRATGTTWATRSNRSTSAWRKNGSGSSSGNVKRPGCWT